MTEVALSKNKQKRLKNQQIKRTLKSHSETHEVRVAINVGTLMSHTVIAVETDEVSDDGTLPVRIFGKRYRLVLEKLESPYTVFYGWDSKSTAEFLDFDKALQFYQTWQSKMDPPRIVGTEPFTEPQEVAILAATQKFE